MIAKHLLQLDLRIIRELQAVSLWLAVSGKAEAGFEKHTLSKGTRQVLGGTDLADTSLRGAP